MKPASNTAGTPRARKDVVENHHDIEACVLACWVAELLNVNADVKEYLAREYNAQLKVLEQKFG